MGFLGIGSWELLLILVLALIILGPGKLPEIARTIGRTIRAIKKASSELTMVVTRELEINEKQATTQQEKQAQVEKAPPVESKASTPVRDEHAANPGENQQQNG